MDCSVISLKRNDLFLVQTVDFFYPLIDNPEIMGQIALANVLSDLFAVGVTAIDSLTMILSAPTEFTEKERSCILPLICKGFKEAMPFKTVKINIQNITLNPWCIIGGIATSVCNSNEIISPRHAKVGDIIILTKPIGTQIATNAFTWMQENHNNYKKLLFNKISKEHICESYQIAIKSMIYLNRIAAILMHKYEAHAATDITGFGLLGHANNLALFQDECVEFKINRIPVIKNILKMENILGSEKITKGIAPETSGGLLICLSAKAATKFCEDFYLSTGCKQKAWIIGNVLAVTGNRTAYLADYPEYIHVDL